MTNNLSLNSAYFSKETLKGDEIMQFTGLVDKNGKEIYEGDIFKTRTRKTTNALVKYVEEWGRYMACARQYENGRNFVEGAGVFKNREVIGNIYENPELLNV